MTFVAKGWTNAPPPGRGGAVKKGPGCVEREGRTFIKMQDVLLSMSEPGRAAPHPEGSRAPWPIVLCLTGGKRGGSMCV